MLNEIVLFFLLFIMYSFMGWCIEVVVVFANQKKFVNRGFLIGPCCPIYGFGYLLIYYFLRKYAKDLEVLFVMSCIVCSILEYLTSYLMEKIFKARWWDYSNRKFNLNGRVCLRNVIAFGILGCLMMKVINPFFLDVLHLFSDKLLLYIGIGFLILFVLDIAISFKIINGFKKVTSTIKKDNTEEITKKVRSILLKRGLLYRRLIKAFNFKVSDMFLVRTVKKGAGFVIGEASKAKNILMKNSKKKDDNNEKK